MRNPAIHGLFVIALVALFGAGPARAQEPIPPEKIEAMLQEGMETNLVVVADTSGSMRDLPAIARRGRLRRMLDRFTGAGEVPANVNRSKIEIAREALSSFVNHLPANVNCGLIFYNGCDARWVQGLGAGTRANMVGFISSMQGAGSTPLAASLRLAFGGVAAKAAANPYARNVVLLVTDGEETCESDDALRRVAAEMAGKFVELHIIGFDLPNAGGALQEVGTRYYFAGDSRELEAGLASVEGELSVDGQVDAIPTGK